MRRLHLLFHLLPGIVKNGLNKGQRAAALLYILLSVAGCIVGVWLGEKIDVNHLVLSIGLLYK